MEKDIKDISDDRWGGITKEKTSRDGSSSTKQNAKMQKKKKTLLQFRIGLLSAGGNIRPAVERWGTLSPPQSHFYPLRCEARCNARDLVSSKWQPLMLAKALKCQKKKEKKKPSRFLSLGLLRLHPAKPFINADEIPSPTFRSGSTNV